jgi:hypothetical protein
VVQVVDTCLAGVRQEVQTQAPSHTKKVQNNVPSMFGAFPS